MNTRKNIDIKNDNEKDYIEFAFMLKDNSNLSSQDIDRLDKSITLLSDDSVSIFEKEAAIYLIKLIGKHCNKNKKNNITDDVWDQDIMLALELIISFNLTSAYKNKLKSAIIILNGSDYSSDNKIGAVHIIRMIDDHCNLDKRPKLAGFSDTQIFSSYNPDGKVARRYKSK
jgi:hypothetical protein